MKPNIRKKKYLKFSHAHNIDYGAKLPSFKLPKNIILN